MNLTRFGLQRRPFPTTPDTSCYYAATDHERVAARLTEALEEEEGIALLVGAAGTGKTLLCHRLLERQAGTKATAFITNTHLETPRELLQAVLYDLGLGHDGGSAQELRLRLTDFIVANFSAGECTLIVVDEAHLLPDAALEELRLLTNLEAEQGKAVQVLLAAQPALLARLQAPHLASLAQRLAARVTLHPLSPEESADYLRHHVRVAGADPDAVFTDEALEVIADSAGGVPRLLNQIARRSLAVCDALGADAVDAEVALEAARTGAEPDHDAPAEVDTPPGDEAAEPAAREEADGARPGPITYRFFDPAPRRTA